MVEILYCENLKDFQNDSMCHNSGIEIAGAKGDSVYMTLEVCGEVSVDYEGATYHSFSAMPKELQSIFLNNQQVESEMAGEIYIGNNNWYELFYWEDGLERDFISSDVIDEIPETEEELKVFFEEYEMEYMNYQEEWRKTEFVEPEEVDLCRG